MIPWANLSRRFGVLNRCIRVYKAVDHNEGGALHFTTKLDSCSYLIPGTYYFTTLRVQLLILYRCLLYFIFYQVFL